MEFLNSFQEWFSQTDFYRQFLQNMPPPLNNIYFDTVCIVVIVCYLLFRIVDGLRIAGYHRRLRKRQAKERQEQREAEKLLKERETVVQDKEEKISRFLDICEFYFWNRGGRDAGETGKQTRGFFSRIGRKNYFLSAGDGKLGLDGEPVALASDYDMQMQEVEECRRQEERFIENRRREKERVNDSLNSLEERMRMEPDVPVTASVEAGKDWKLEKRKKKALRKAQKEEERAKRKAERGKKGAEHELGKKN